MVHKSHPKSTHSIKKHVYVTFLLMSDCTNSNGCCKYMIKGMKISFIFLYRVKYFIFLCLTHLCLALPFGSVWPTLSTLRLEGMNVKISYFPMSTVSRRLRVG